MPDEITTLTFKIFFLMEDFRELLRRTSPAHKFNEKTREEAIEIINKIEKNLNRLKEII